MIEHIWTVVCERAIVDVKTGGLYLQNAIEEILIPAEPKPDGILRFPLSIVSYWTRPDINQPTKARFRIIFSFAEKERELFRGEIDLTESIRHRFIVEINALPLSESGQYHFIVELETDNGEWSRVARIPIGVVFQPET